MITDAAAYIGLTAAQFLTAAFLCVFAFLALRKVISMLSIIIAQIARLRDEVIPALSTAMELLKADNAALRAQVEDLQAQLSGIDQANVDLTTAVDSIQALAA
jgi:cell division protein FtsB